ncbi:MAG: type II secretion system protein [Coprobacillus sp.]
MKKNKGFTLIEIVITVALIAVIMSLTVPGVMNYFRDVDMDKSTAEATSVMAMVQSYQDKLSLSGSDSSSENITITDQIILNPIVKKAKGNGKIETVTFENGKIKKFKYVVSDYSIELSVSGKLVVLDADDEFY